MSEQKPNWFKRHKVLTVILVLFVIGVIGSLAGGDKSSTATKTTNETTTPTTQEAPKNWKVIAELTGTEDSKQTASFPLKEGDTRIRYEIEGKTDTAASMLYLLKEGSTKTTNERGEFEIASAIDTVIGTKQGQKIIKQHAGNYFLEINASNVFTYKVFVEQQED